MSTDVSYRYNSEPFRQVFEHASATWRRAAQQPALRVAARRCTIPPAIAAGPTRSSGRTAAGWRRACTARRAAAEDVIVFDLLNGPEFALVWIAAQRLGAVATPINFRLAAGEVAHVLDDSRPRVFIHRLERRHGRRGGAVDRADAPPVPGRRRRSRGLGRARSPRLPRSRSCGRTPTAEVPPWPDRSI